MRVPSKSYKGIIYVELSQLPIEQYNSIIDWIDSDQLIALKIDSQLVTKCLQYSDYLHWYDNVFSKAKQSSETKKEPTNKSIFGFAFDTSRE